MRFFCAVMSLFVVGSTPLTLGSTPAARPRSTLAALEQSSASREQTPARPLRPGETPPKGAAVMRGQVVALGTGAPIRRAQVRAMSADGRGGGATTDNEGNFEIKDLAAGRYSVTASKIGFVNGQYGQRRPGDPGTLIEISESQVAQKVNLALSRGGVVSGKVVDDSGEPVYGTQVTAMRYQFLAGQGRLVSGGSEGSSDRTDDQGSFRLFGLAPGDYYVSATARNGTVMTAEFNNHEADGFVPTYYPGTPNVGEATRITVKAGQEMSGANFAMIVARMSRIRGRAFNSRGEPVARGIMMLTPADPTTGVTFMMNGNAMIGPDGSFQFNNVAPGHYHINVRPNGIPSGTDEMALMPITVGGEDLDNVIVATSLGAIARGNIITDDGTAPTFRPDQVQLFARPVEMAMNALGGGPSRVNDDFSFELNSLFGRRLLRGSASADSGWYLKAVLFDGQDVTDRGVEFTPGQAYEGLQVVFTRKTTTLSGQVNDDRKRPVVDASVIIFPSDPEKWNFQSRYVRTARPDTNGRYSVQSLPPSDDYLIIAVQNLESGQASDPDFLRRARQDAQTLSLNEGETKAFDVTLSKLIP